MRLASVLAAVVVACAGCGTHAPPQGDGDPANGALLLRQFGCGTCHVIPGVAAAQGTVGPSLDGIARRSYLAGFLPNTPPTMARWIRDPQALSPGTLMPDLGVSEPHALDMVAYLRTLR
jgi:cytochrome c2